MNVTTVRALTLNLWGMRGDWNARKSILAKGLESLQPDLVGFQESIVRDRIDQVADLLGSEYYIVHHARREPDGQGISTASRWPIGQTVEVDLQVTPRTADFACTSLLTEILAPEPLGPLLFTNHCPNWQSDFELERELQAVRAARAIEDFVRDRSMHVILAGDFTATPNSASVRFWCGRQSLGGLSVCYGDSWAKAHPDHPGYTFASHNPLRSNRWRQDPPKRIDYLFVRAGNASPTLEVNTCKLVFDQSMYGTWASDHFGVMAEFGVPPADSG